MEVSTAAEAVVEAWMVVVRAVTVDSVVVNMEKVAAVALAEMMAAEGGMAVGAAANVVELAGAAAAAGQKVHFPFPKS